MTIQYTIFLQNLQRSLFNGVRPFYYSPATNALPATEELTDCQSVSTMELSDSLDCVLDDDAESASVDEEDDLASQQRKRRHYRAQYLRCKRLKSKGYKVAMPVKPWAVNEKVVVAAADVSTLSKDEIRRIKNRESAERSRKAISEVITNTQKAIAAAKHENAILQGERAFILQQLSMISSYVKVSSGNQSPGQDVDSDCSSLSGSSISDLSGCSHQLSSNDSFDQMDFDFEETLTDEALEVLLNSLC